MSRTTGSYWLLTLGLVISLLSVPSANAQSIAAPKKVRKIALLIGVSDYFDRHIQKLQYAESDIKAVAKQLKAIGFSVFPLSGPTATRRQVQRSINDFLELSEKLDKDDIVLVMLSGHGQQLMSLHESRVLVNGKPEIVKRKRESTFFLSI